MGSAFSFTTSSRAISSNFYAMPNIIIQTVDEEKLEAVGTNELQQYEDVDEKSKGKDPTLHEGSKSKRPRFTTR